MNWQLLICGIAVGLAVGFLALNGWRSWRGLKTGCTGGCGCAKTPASAKNPPVLIPSDQLVLRK